MAATEPATPDDRTAARRRGRVSARTIGLLAAIALGVLGLDQLTKYLVVTDLAMGQTVPLLGELLQLHRTSNSGAAFSFATGFTWVLSLVAVGVIVFIVWFAPRIRSLAWATMFGLVLGGAFGNLVDRLFRDSGWGNGLVVDFIQIWGFPAIFNVADIAITSAMALFVLLSLRGVRLDGTRAPAADVDDEPDED
ncbi:MAG: signal peptidase II [Actinomycetales bacterium]|nr:signal peptidase II [Actinomycetales bacterium]